MSRDSAAQDVQNVWRSVRVSRLMKDNTEELT